MAPRKTAAAARSTTAARVPSSRSPPTASPLTPVPRRSVRVAKAKGAATPPSFAAENPAAGPSGVTKKKGRNGRGRAGRAVVPAAAPETTNLDPLAGQGYMRITRTVFELAAYYDMREHSELRPIVAAPDTNLLSRRLARLNNEGRRPALMNPPTHDLAQQKIRALQAEVNELKAYWTVGVYGRTHGPGNRDTGVWRFETPEERRSHDNLPDVLIELRRQFWAIFELQIWAFTEERGWAVPGQDVVGLDQMMFEMQQMRARLADAGARRGG